MRSTGHTWAWGLTLGACLFPLLWLAAACGSSPSTTPSPSPSLSGKAAIVADWQRFFSGATPVAQKIALLQDGQSFAAALKAQAGSPLAKAARAKVSAVTITSPTTATVSYSIVIGNQTASATQAPTFSDPVRRCSSAASGRSPQPASRQCSSSRGRARPPPLPRPDERRCWIDQRPGSHRLLLGASLE